ncbi:MAG TPA: hydrogenase maturation nickel metallochaperone HypA [Bacteroidota bacterium]|nr:hydrogenase maturation nickel metallochaperone HypA [Bacteroidota bacterium]
MRFNGALLAEVENWIDESRQMHELSIAQSILQIVQKHIPSGAGGRLRSVTVRIGEDAGVVPDSLEFSFEVLTRSTELEHARLHIEKVPLVISCKKCGDASTVEFPFFFCPRCNSRDVEIIAGDELQVVSIELADALEESV